MKYTNLLFTVPAIAAFMFLSGFTMYQSIDWQIKDDFSIKFESKDPTGKFTEMSGDIIFDPDNLEASRFNVKVAVNSINTGNGMKNKHAKSANWFDAEQYPTINYNAEKFAKTADGFEAYGVLEMHGVSKDFTMPFTFENNVFNSSFSVNRIEYGIGSMKGMSKKVPGDLAVTISVPVEKK